MTAGSATVARALVLHPEDDVAVLIEPVEAGGRVLVSGGRGMLRLHAGQGLPLGHKIALHDMPVGHGVRKYGEIIGTLTAAVVAGEHVHVHNIKSARAL